jgi:MFS family permease
MVADTCVKPILQAGLAQSMLLLLGSCLPVLGAVLLAPVLPRMQAHFADVDNSAVLVPIVLTLPALVIALLAPFAGLIADRLGRKPLLLASMLLYVLCGVLPLWLDSLHTIVLSRAGIGLAEAGIMTCCTTLMGDYYSGARRERLFAIANGRHVVVGCGVYRVGWLPGAKRLAYAVCVVRRGFDFSAADGLEVVGASGPPTA